MVDTKNSPNTLEQLWNSALDTLQTLRNVTHETLAWSSPGPQSISEAISSLSTRLEAISKHAEAEALLRVHEKATDPPSFGGLGLSEKSDIQQSDCEEVLFLLGAWLESLNSQERIERPPTPSDDRSSNTRPMTLAEKIFAQHTVGGCDERGLQAGDVIRTSVDWILASELSWAVSVLVISTPLFADNLISQWLELTKSSALLEYGAMIDSGLLVIM